MIIREFVCGDCGAKFESSAPIDDVCCPRCSSDEAERAFFTPPGIRSPQTTFKDATVRGLAADFGLSDVSNKHGEPVKRAGQRGPAPAHAKWGGGSAAQIAQRAAAVPQGLIDSGNGFSHPQPLFVGKVK